MDQLIFYWCGENTEIPSILVESVLISNNDVNIIQISDHQTNKINGVNEVYRIKKTENLLMDRIKGYSLIKTKNKRTFF